MSLSIGRVGRSGDIELEDPTVVDLAGDLLTLRGITDTTVADALHLRDQLQGLNDPDERDVPVVFGGSFANMDGFYRIEAVDVPSSPGAGSLGHVDWSARLRRIPNYRAVTVEVDFVRALRANTHSITAGSLATAPVLAIPTGDWYRIPTSFTVGAEDRTTADGATLRVGNAFTADGFASTIFGVSPSAYYVGSCALEESIAGNFRAVTGRQILNDLDGWRLTNGLIRVTPNASNTARLDVSHWDGSAWDTAKVYRWESGVGGVYGSAVFSSVDTAKAVQVLRNAPDSITIRVVTLPPSATAVQYGANYYDLTIWRGSRRVDLKPGLGIMIDHARLGLVTGEAATDLTGAIRATSNDASGNRFVLGTNRESNQELGSGKVSSATASQAVTFFISSEIGGSGATGLNTAQNEAYSYYVAGSSRQWIHGGAFV